MINKFRIPLARLDQRIEIYNADNLKIHECWSRIKNVNGKEILAGNIQYGEASTSFVIRYTTTKIPTDSYIQYNGFHYDIKYVNDMSESHQFIEIIATKRSWDVMLT